MQEKTDLDGVKKIAKVRIINIFGGGKKVKKRWGAIALAIVFGMVAFFCVACTKKSPRNLIYVIGDGMGFQHIENTKLYMDAEKLRFEDYYVGEVTTRSADSEVTDSAAGATALATGIKTTNGTIGRDADGNDLENIMEISKKAGKRTGILTTDTLNGATPAGFSVHTYSRNDTYRICAGHQTGGIDLLIGEYESDYFMNQTKFEANGFAYAETMEELKLLPKSDKVLVNMQDFKPIIGEGVSLKELVEYALDFLSEDNKEGFTLMVEGAYIDKHSHNNDLFSMIYALMDLNVAIEYMLDWASTHKNTAIIITADHETGGLRKAENKEYLSNALYSTAAHTESNVPLYLYNAKTELTNIDNTDVFHIAKQIVEG